jgi:PAS domain S-box-containing protein
MDNPEQEGELFRLAVESAPNSMILVDEAGRIVLVNAQTERLFGYPRAELLGRTIDILVPVRFRGAHPGHRRSFFAEPQVRSMGAGRDLFGLRKDGSEVPVEIGLNPFKTATASYVLAAIVDITERKRAEERFRAVVESSPSAMLMVDAKGKIVLVNAQTEKLFGYTRQEILGQSIELLVPGRFRDRHPGHRAEFHGAPRSRPMGADRDLYGLRKDGSEVPVEIGLNPIKTAEGDFVLAAVVDLTVFKRMQAEMIRTQNLAAIGEMAATIAHEVKNPLAAISGPLQILEEDLKVGNPHKELMGEILAQVKRLDQTVRGLLAFSKPTTPSKQPIPLQEFVERIGRLVGEHRQDIKVVYEGPADALLAADPPLLEQVLWNLFLNGMEAMKGSGRIRVVARSTPGSLELSVVDTGSGIAPDLLQKIFKPFVTTKTTGTGLGLSLCRKIVEAHRGTIEISSVSGTGTTVLLRFPSSPSSL